MLIEKKTIIKMARVALTLALVFLGAMATALPAAGETKKITDTFFFLGTICLYLFSNLK